MQAWQYGPVIQTVYNTFRSYGGSPIHPDAAAIISDEPLTQWEKELLDEVWRVYHKASAFQLSALTHQTDSPWHTAFLEGGLRSVIPTDLIRDHYRQKVAARLRRTEAQAGE